MQRRSRARCEPARPRIAGISPAITGRSGGSRRLVPPIAAPSASRSQRFSSGSPATPSSGRVRLVPARDRSVDDPRSSLRRDHQTRPPRATVNLLCGVGRPSPAPAPPWCPPPTRVRPTAFSALQLLVLLVLLALERQPQRSCPRLRSCGACGTRPAFVRRSSFPRTPNRCRCHRRRRVCARRRRTSPGRSRGRRAFRAGLGRQAQAAARAPARSRRRCRRSARRALLRLRLRARRGLRTAGAQADGNRVERVRSARQADDQASRLRVTTTPR